MVDPAYTSKECPVCKHHNEADDCIYECKSCVGGKAIEIRWAQSILARWLALMVRVKVPWEPDMLDPWKAVPGCLIWKADGPEGESD